jgi:hypothetical protein
LIGGVIAFVGPTLAYVLMLGHPQPLFAHSVRVGNLELHSDRPFEEAAGRDVLGRVAAKLAASPLDAPDTTHHVFLCNARWRYRLFFLADLRASGLNYSPLTSNVFLRAGDIAGNRIISSRGTPVEGDRTLDYLITHEIVHTLCCRHLGSVRYHRLPQWTREGYADYVAKGSAIDYDAALRAMRAGDREMDFRRSGLYWRFHLLVAYLLEREGWSLDRLFATEFAPEAIEARVQSAFPPH